MARSIGTAVRGRPGGRLRPVLLALLVGGAAAVLVRERAALGAAVRELPAWVPVASAAPAVLGMLAALGVWRSTFAAFGSPVAARPAARIFYASQLGKYLPGAVWSIASQLDLTRDLRIPRRTVVAAGLVTVATSVAVGLPMAAVLLPWVAPAALQRVAWVFLAAPLLLAVLHPAVLHRVLGAALRLARRDPLPARPDGAALARAACWQGAVWVLLGLHAWVLAVGLGAPPGPALAAAVGGYALAYPLGLVSLLPGGAGVRDGVLTLVLTTVLPAPAALLLAVLSRATLVVVDLALAAAVLLAVRRPPAPPPPG